MTAPTDLLEQLRGLPRKRRPRACAQLHCPEDAYRQTRVLHQSLARLGQRVVDLTAVIDELEAEITEIVDDLAPGMIADEPGVGARSLAQILLSWSHAGRITSEAAFGMLSGTAPVPVSSGRTDRYRLNRHGDRQLNRALHMVATNRMRHHPETVAYVQRRRDAGKPKRDPPLHQALPRPTSLPPPEPAQHDTDKCPGRG